MRRKTPTELKQEIEANRFAMELLMPEELVRREAKKFGDCVVQRISKLARLFEVEEAAMTVRLMQLGYFEPYQSAVEK